MVFHCAFPDSWYSLEDIFEYRSKIVIRVPQVSEWQVSLKFVLHLMTDCLLADRFLDHGFASASNWIVLVKDLAWSERHSWGLSTSAVDALYSTNLFEISNYQEFRLHISTSVCVDTFSLPIIKVLRTRLLLQGCVTPPTEPLNHATKIESRIGGITNVIPLSSMSRANTTSDVRFKIELDSRGRTIAPNPQASGSSGAKNLHEIWRRNMLCESGARLTR